MLAEGTYPYHWGGVSTWCHLLIRDLPYIDFELVSLCAAPGMTTQFELPGNVVAFHPLPLWGMRIAGEPPQLVYMRELRQRKQSTTDDIVAAHFAPLFKQFLRELYFNQRGPHEMANTIHAMHRFFLAYDFDAAMRSPITWQTLTAVVQESFPIVAAQLGYPNAHFQLADMITAMQWLYHWFFALGAPIAKADVTHAAMAGICTLMAVAAKKEHGAAYMLTEHGIYLRERYLAEAASTQSFFLKVLALSFARRMTEVSYALADQISPCCNYNHRWELRNGAQPEQIRTIYYGVDANTFAPEAKPFGDPPVVVWVGRIDPLKDLLTLIRAAGVVHESRPDIQFRLFGSAPAGNEGYYEECLALRKELGLEATVIFAGYRSNASSAFNEGDVVVLSSISEAFPFVILEAMLCAKPVVATGVGGIPEQLVGCGFALEPRNPTAMAEAILKIMGDPELATILGQAARVRAEREFTVRQSGLAHDASYRRVIKRRQLDTMSTITRPPHVLAYSTEVLQEYGLENLPIDLLRHSAEMQATEGSANVSLSLHSVECGQNQTAILSQKQPGFLPRKFAFKRNNVPFAASSIGTGTVLATNVAALLGQASITSLPVIWSTPATNGSSNGNNAAKSPARVFNNGQPADMNGYNDGQGISHDHPARTFSTRTDNHWQMAHAEAVAPLAMAVRERDPHPLDELEVTAVIESMGVTDEVAQLRYGATDAFALGQAILENLRSMGMVMPKTAAVHFPSVTVWEACYDCARGFLALLPALVLLCCIFVFSEIGQWGQGAILALSAGWTSSMLVTNGFIQAVSRRTSILLGLGKPAAAGSFLWRSLAAAFLVLSALVLFAELAASHYGLFTTQQRLIYLLGFLSLSALWMAAGGLALIQQNGWLAIGMVGGLLAGASIERLLAPWTGLHLILGALVGYVTAMYVIIAALRRGYADSGSAQTGAKQPLHLPSPAYLLHEARPFFAYGFLYMALILLPHILGWLGTLGVHQVRSWAVINVELGLTASMPPLMIAGGVAEHTLRCFWRMAPALMQQTPGGALSHFRQSLTRFYWRYALLYLSVLGGLSLVMHLVFQELLQAGVIQRLFHLSNTDGLLFIFYAGLAAYGLLGLGIFSAMFCITLGAPQLAVRAVIISLTATLIVGIPLSGMNYALSALAFVYGAVVFAVVTWGMADRVLQAADYQFALGI
ncbi:MAG: GT4 family glycosyltransferase PelF [Caldilineaceae bacterium]